MDIGTKINGVYLGTFNVSGVVEDRRNLTVKTDGCVEHVVKLDSPIEVFGRIAESLIMHTLDDGQPSSYTRFSTSMCAA